MEDYIDEQEYLELIDNTEFYENLSNKLQDRIDKAINYVEDCEWEDYPIQTTTHHKLREEIIGKDLLDILKGDNND